MSLDIFLSRLPDDVARESADDGFPFTANHVRGLRHLPRPCADRGLGPLGM